MLDNLWLRGLHLALNGVLVACCFLAAALGHRIQTSAFCKTGCRSTAS
tara:strand:- start:1184 stop:1327 length:144 start_codon:yes stop_codon:yes gene_type:complete